MHLFPLHYAGSISYYKALCNAPEVVFDLHEHFPKQTHRNRMEILGPNSVQKLVIPTLKTGSHRPMGEVEISYRENWRKDHWKSLEAAYRKSPYFEFYERELESIIRGSHVRLADLNMEMHQLICRILDIEIRFTTTTDYFASAEWDYRAASFDQASADGSEKSYLQVFSDRFAFVPNLSILDAIFNLGPQATELLS